MVSCHVAVPVAPPAICPNVVAEVAVAVQPSGTVIDRAMSETAVVPPLVNVALTDPDWPEAMTGGVELVSVPCTTITAVPGLPLTVTVMVATPSLTARTSPLEVTLAMEGSLLR